jgi:hypothetical protein
METMSQNSAQRAIGRIKELDLLRGYFIAIILIDHIQRWPSVYIYLTGEGRLWTSAAEGFFIISGLLIGYLRGYKSRHLDMRTITKKLFSRAVMLYLWCVGISFFVFSITAIFSDGQNPLLPKLPEASQVANLPTYLWTIISGQYENDWIYFLRLYAIILAISPLVIWLLRKGLWWVALSASILTYIASFFITQPEGAMQWQLLFFSATLIGWKLETILQWLRTHPRAKTIIIRSSIAITLITMAMSFFWVHGWGAVESGRAIISRDGYVTTRGWLDPWFTNNPMAVGRVVLSFVWFAGLLAIFHILRRPVNYTFGWLLMTFGQYSLSAYCLQAILLVFVQVIMPVTENPIINFVYTTTVIVGFWALMQISFVRRLLPR